MARTARRQKESSKESETAAPKKGDAGTNGAGEEGSEAQVDIRMKGTAGAVSEAAGRLAAEPEMEKPETVLESGRDIDDPIAALLADPRNVVVVKRLKPREFNNRRITGNVDTWECPIERDEIENDVLDRHGGQRYKATIHPNTAGGQAKILDAWTFGNDRLQPIIEGNDGVVDSAEESEVEVTDPIEIARNAIKRKMVFLTDRAQLKEAELALQQLEDSDPKKKDPEADRDGRDNEIRDLRDQLKAKNLQDQLNARLGPMEKSMSELTGAMTRFLDNQNRTPQADGSKDVLMEMLRSGDTRFNTMMTNFTTALSKQSTPQKEQNVTTMLADLAKLKEVLGSESAQSSRVKDFESRLMDLAFDKLEGGGGNGGDNIEEDPLKFAIKELSPTFKVYVEKKLEMEGKEKVRDMSPEEKKEYFRKAAKEEAKKLEEKWKSEGYLVKVPTGAKKPAPGIKQKTEEQKKKEAEAAAKLGTTKTVEVSAADTTSKPGEAPKPPAEEKPQGEEMGRFAKMPYIGKVEVPPSPHEDGYSRQQAVDFVLDAIRSEIRQRIPHDKPEETFVVADALDRFDDELLFTISQVETGQQMDEALMPYGDEAKLSEIKKSGDENDKVKAWLKRIILTLQDEWKRKAAKPPAK